MADNSVFITGSEEGALAKAFDGLPPWASQKTSEDILKTLRQSLGVQNKTLAQMLKTATAGGTGLSSKDVKDAGDEFAKISKTIQKLNEEEEKSLKRKKKEDKTDKDRESRESASSTILTTALTALTSAGSKLLGVQKQYFTTSEDLFKAGINLLSTSENQTSSMLSLNEMVTLTGMRLETFSKVVLKYTDSINAVGVTKFAKSISLANTRLIGLGYSSEQQAELIGTMVDAQSSYTDIRGKSERDLADDAVRLGNQMTRLSILTGQSNAQLQENIKSLAKNSDSTVVSALYGEKAAERMNNFSASIKDANLAKSLQTLAASGQPQVTKMYQDFAKAGLGDVAQAMTQVAVAARDGAISSEVANKRLTALGQNIDPTKLANLQRLSQVGADGAQSTLDAIVGLRAQGNKTSTANAGQADAAIKAQSSLSAFSTELEKSKSLVERAFPLLEDQVDLATTALKAFNNTVTSVTDMLSATTRSWIAVGIQALAVVVTAIGSLVTAFGILKLGSGSLLDKFAAVGRGLWSLLNPIAKVVAAFAAGYAFGTVLYEMISKFDWFNNMMDKIFSGLDHILKYIPIVGSDARERIKTREKEAAASSVTPIIGSGKPTTATTTTTVPKEPARSTIKSPSAVPADTAKTSTASTTTAAVDSAIAGIPITPRPADINSTLSYQNSILIQLLESSQNLVSVNKDILKYTKVQS